MDEKEKKSYLERYREAKEKGVPFFPDIIFKDAVFSLLVFIVLVVLAYFAGAPVEARADPTDTTYTPRPEWYFLFIFQLLKYFPGQLEVIGAMVLPGLFIVLLVLLPFIDKSPKRHFRSRPFASIAGLVVLVGVGLLTVLAILENPPPAEAIEVDRAAALYSANCANCHGPSLDVPPATDLHRVIAAGTHEGMPAWGGDLSADEIDILAGFIRSPNGSAVYNQQCGDCHKESVLATGNPAELQRVLGEGPDYPAHQGLEIPNWDETLSSEERNTLLNFLAAPDGQRLFVINCSGCHGQGVAFSGTESDLHNLIAEGGQHLTMPGWKGTLAEADLDVLAAYTVNPESIPSGESLFGQHCTACHGDKVPIAPDIESARKIIGGGGAHVDMPVWGDILTPEQLNALVQYTLDTSKGSGIAQGAQLFAETCSSCHGQFGEGGPNPARAGDVIAPISSAEYLKTRDDATLRNIISQGQSDIGMAPYGITNGGPLSDQQIDAIITFIRRWEANPPVELPPEIIAVTPSAPEQVSPSGSQVFGSVCARCHGPKGEGGIGSALNTQEFQDSSDDEAIFDTISSGHEATSMIAWGEILTADQIQELVRYIRSLAPESADAETSVPVSFSRQVLPIFDTSCKICHNSQSALGGWDSSSYQSVMTSGNHAPVVKAGDTTRSILAQRILGTGGSIMPPSGELTQREIQIILDWIAAGALDN